MMFYKGFLDLLMPKVVYSIAPIVGAALIGGAATLGSGAMSAFGGGGGEGGYEFKGEAQDYYAYDIAKERETRIKILDMLNKKSYEAFPGQRNLRVMSQGSVRSMMDKPPPNYLQMAEESISGEGEGYKPYAAYADIKKDPENMTEWDKMAEEHGLVVTVYDDFDSAIDIQNELYRRNLAESSIGFGEVAFAQQALFGVLDAVAPGLGSTVRSWCSLGQCDEMFAEFGRGVKAFLKTQKDMGDDFDPFGAFA